MRILTTIQKKIKTHWDGSPAVMKYSIILIAGLGIGIIIASADSNKNNNMEARVNTSTHKEEIWTCSMHPQIRLPKPGKCPICGMTLIMLENDQEDTAMPSARRLVMSPDAMKLADIQTHEVEQKFVASDIRMTGKVDYDETNIAYITAWVSGRIDRLYVEETGVPVRKGDHLAYLYSPELISAQEEYLQALEGNKKVKDSHLEIIRSTSEETIKNAREKLKLLGITDSQIGNLEQQAVPSDHMTIYSPAAGIVIKRDVQKGDYVKTGQRIYSIADLNKVWIKLDAYESELSWLRYGQDVSFEVEAYPGELFHGRISFIDPVLNEKTRTIKVRVNVENKKLLLKPGMFVRATVHAEVAETGEVVDTYLSDKWICPMHPSEISEGPGTCSICDMPLVSTKELGYRSVNTLDPPLVVPASAVMKTGRRAIVYVKRRDTKKPTFDGREIILGVRAADYYIVKSGLSKGELVVTNGNFKIDSALQIQAKPSMMSPEGGGSRGGGHHHGAPAMKKEEKKEEMPMKMKMAPHAFLEQLNDIYSEYFSFQEALAHDDLLSSKKALNGMKEKVTAVNMNLLEGDMHARWMEYDQQLKNSISLGLEEKTLVQIRNDVLSDISRNIISIENYFGHEGNTYYEIFCPMALDNTGASWLQRNKDVLNPFFGKAMQQCGEVTEEFSAVNNIEAKAGEHETHGGGQDGR